MVESDRPFARRAAVLQRAPSVSPISSTGVDPAEHRSSGKRAPERQPVPRRPRRNRIRPPLDIRRQAHPTDVDLDHGGSGCPPGDDENFPSRVGSEQRRPSLPCDRPPSPAVRPPRSRSPPVDQDCLDRCANGRHDFRELQRRRSQTAGHPEDHRRNRHDHPPAVDRPAGRDRAAAHVVIGRGDIRRNPRVEIRLTARDRIRTDHRPRLTVVRRDASRPTGTNAGPGFRPRQPSGSGCRT